MKTRKLTIVLILAAVILAPMALAASEKGPGSKKDRKRPLKPKPTSRSLSPSRSSRGELGQMLLGPMGKELKLTDKQQKKIKAIVKETTDCTPDEILQAVEKGYCDVPGGGSVQLVLSTE